MNITLEKNIIRDSLIENTLNLKRYNKQLEIDKEKNIEIAILSERNRIARKLHDSIGHFLSSSIIQTEALKVLVSDENLSKSLDMLKDTLKAGMEDTRKSIHNLYSESLDLESKIYESFLSFPNLNCHLEYNLSKDLQYNFKFDILSIVNEGLTNTSKHSNASELKISILEHPGFYSISIRDNGSKFNKDIDLLDKGIGILSMQEIAKKYKGILNYSFDKGFSLYVTLMKEEKN